MQTDAYQDVVRPTTADGQRGVIAKARTVLGRAKVAGPPRTSGIRKADQLGAQAPDRSVDHPDVVANAGRRIVGDGTFAVGADVEPGLYRSTGHGFWERRSGPSDRCDAIIANCLGDGATYAEIMPGDKYFATLGFQDWVPVNGDRNGPQATSFGGTGMYIVGADIAAGTYRSTGHGTWQRLSGASGQSADVIARDTFTGSAVVTIQRSDKFFSTLGTGEWTKVD